MHPSTPLTAPAATATTPRVPTPASRRTYFVAGASLVLMAVLAGVGYLVAIDGLVTPGDAATTTAISGSQTSFRFGIVSLLGVVVLDVVVAFALYRIFAGVHRALSAIAAAARFSYAAVLAAAVLQLVAALGVVAGGRAPGSTSTDVMSRIDAFHAIWDAGLIVFGVHLLVIAYLVYRSGFLPRFLGILLAVAGIGYVFDSIAALVVTGPAPEISTVTFVGELLLAVWLLARGRRTRTVR